MKPTGLLLAAVLSAAGADDAPSFDIRLVDLHPTFVEAVQPVYPPELFREGIEGSANIEFIIDTDGRVQQVRIISASEPAFGTAAAAAVKSWRFTPGQAKGRPVNVRTRQELDFTLDDVKSIPMKVLHLKSETLAKMPGFDWDTPPSLPVQFPPIVYPFEALRDKRAGRVVVRFVVEVDGKMKQPAIMEATAPEFGQAVIAAVNATPFTPALKKGERRRSLVEATVEFKPNGKGDVLVRASAVAILKLLAKNPAEIVPLKDLDGAPKMIKKVTPVYPGALDNPNQPGRAVIEFFIDRGGHAQLPRVLSSTAPEFGYAAMEAVSDWTFEPPKKGGKKVVALVQIPIQFGEAEPSSKQGP
jgi:TonB family protein